MCIGVTFEIIPSLHFAMKNENLVQFRGLTIIRFIYRD